MLPKPIVSREKSLEKSKNVARYSSARLAYARRDLATRNDNFTWAAEAEAL